MGKPLKFTIYLNEAGHNKEITKKAKNFNDVILCKMNAFERKHWQIIRNNQTEEKFTILDWRLQEADRLEMSKNNS